MQQYRILLAVDMGHGKVHKISGHTRGRNVNVSWFEVTRTPEDAPSTPEDAPVVFCSTFRELPGATGIASIGARIQKLGPCYFEPGDIYISSACVS